MHYVEIPGHEILIVATAEGEYYGLGAVCTHGFGYLDQGQLMGCEVQCPLHEGRFDIRTGEPTNPPVIEPVRSYAVEILDDEVYVSW